MRNAKDHVPFLFLVYKELQGPAIAMKKELANLKADEEAIVRVSISALERYAWLTVLRKNSQRLAPGTHDLLEESGHNLNTLHLNVSFMLPLSPLSMESIGRITKDTGCDVCQKQDANICVGCRSAQYCGKGKLLLRPSTYSMADNRTRNQSASKKTGLGTKPPARPSVAPHGASSSPPISPVVSQSARCSTPANRCTECPTSSCLPVARHRRSSASSSSSSSNSGRTGSRRTCSCTTGRALS